MTKIAVNAEELDNVIQALEWAKITVIGEPTRSEQDEANAIIRRSHVTLESIRKNGTVV